MLKQRVHTVTKISLLAPGNQSPGLINITARTFICYELHTLYHGLDYQGQHYQSPNTCIFHDFIPCP